MSFGPLPQHVKDYAIVHNNLAVRLYDEGARDAAIVMARRSLAINPYDHNAIVNLGIYLGWAGEIEDATALAEVALRANPDNSNALSLKATLELIEGRLDSALECNRRAAELDPKSAQKQFDLACGYLRLGDFARGWPLFEARHRIEQQKYTPPAAPTWTGERVKHLFVWSEQGLGDRVQFARFLPMVADRVDRITFGIDNDAAHLFAGYGKCCRIYVPHDDDDLKDCDAQIALMSLPRVLGIDLDNLPSDPRLLPVGDTAGALIADGLKIGLAWAGNPKHANDRVRSMPFEEFLPLAADVRHTLYGFQVGPRSADIARARAQRLVTDLSGLVEGNVAATPALIGNLDLIITVDTGLAHIAASMGKPVFLLLSRFNDWRWLWGRDDSPWYPSIRIFRQDKLGNWKGVINRVAGALNELHIDRSQQAAAKAAQIVIPYEPDVAAVMRKVLRSGDTFVDVGANVGKHTVAAANIVGATGKVLAFEPGRNCLPALRDATRHLAQVHIIAQPVWYTSDEVTFHLNADDSGGNAMWDPGDCPPPHNPKSKEHKQPVGMLATTLDEHCSEEQDTVPVRLIKIDTEGAEHAVLGGAARLLSKVKPPFIIAELHEFGLQKLGSSQEALRSYMEGMGYSTFVLFANGANPQLLPPNTTIKTGLVVNILFSTPEAVGEVWGDYPIEFNMLRSMWAYGLPATEASAA